jgi:hypothetical protein
MTPLPTAPVQGVDASVVLSSDTASSLSRGLKYGGVLVIASGLITIMAPHYSVDTEAETTSDNLAGAYGGGQDTLFLIHPTDDARTVVVKHNDTTEGVDGTRFFLSDDADATLDDIDDAMLFAYVAALDSGNGGWMELSRGNMAALLAAHAAASDPHTGYPSGRPQVATRG